MRQASSNKIKVTHPNTNRIEVLSDETPEIIQPYAKTKLLGLKDPRWKKYNEEYAKDRTYEWKTPIEFFGKVIDENNKPVANAAVEAQWVGLEETRDGVGKKKLSSDINGKITITGLKGKCMSVRVSKKGYFTSHKIPNNDFEYAGFWEPNFIEPDRENPVIFHLIKRVPRESVKVIGYRVFELPSTIMYIDLLSQNGFSPSQGDFTIKVSRESLPGNANIFNGSIDVRSIGSAEFSESDEELMMSAPDNGYVKSITKTFRNNNGSTDEILRFYIRNSERKFYAKVELKFVLLYPKNNQQTICTSINSVVNQNNSPVVAWGDEQ